MDATTIWNMLLSFVVACICVWAVLTTKLRTTSIEVLALGVIFIGALLNIETPLHTGSVTEPGELFTNLGIVCYGVFVCLRLSLKPWIDNVYRRLHIEERLHLRRRATDQKEKTDETRSDQ